jgi:hypothetical protein
VDFEAWEQALCEAVLAGGARLLEKLLAPLGCGRPAQRVLNSKGQPMRSLGQREKTIHTVLGPICWRRSVFADAARGETRCPGDEVLGVVDTGFSPGLRRRMARAGSRAAFAEAAEDLAVYAHVTVDPKDVQRVAEATGRQVEEWMNQEAAAATAPRPPNVTPARTLPLLYISFDGTGVPVRRPELEGRHGKQADGSARTREVKLGCVFTQTATDEQGRPVRDPHSTSYVGAIESSELFGWRIYGEAMRRGLAHAQRVVVLTDGASYNKTILRTHFSQAIHIIDLYHAREHLHDLGAQWSVAPAQQARWLEFLDQGQIPTLLTAVNRHVATESASVRKAVEGELRYFADNAAAMRYAHFRQQGLFVGSGVVEAGCRTVIGQRLKRSGMFWSVRGANAIIASRCCQYSQRFDDFWEAAAA